MILDESIQHLICEKAGYVPSHSSDFEKLSDDIFHTTRQHLGVNTLKRLFGQLSEVETSKTTLDIIALYLGYSNWNKLRKETEGVNSVFDITNTIFPNRLEHGKIFSVIYSPNRELQLEVMNNGWCKVLSSSAGKLQKGDVLDITSITPHVPLIVNDVIRNESHLGSFIGGIGEGVITINI
jgi:hypothetical protein